MPLGAGASLRDRGQFFGTLAASLDAGVPVDRSLEIVAGSSGRFADAARDLSRTVRGGGALSDGMRRNPIFLPYEAEVVAAGERAGRIVEVLRRISDRCDRLARAADRIGTGLLYPAVLLVAAVLLPALPLLVTRGSASYLEATLPWLGLMVLAAGVGIVAARGGALMRWGLLLPWIGPLIRRLLLADFLDLLALLIDAGVPLLGALTTAGKANRDPAIRSAAVRSAAAVRRGEELWTSIADSIFPPLVVQAVRAGEAAGRLDEALRRAEVVARQEAETALDRLVVLLPLGVYLAVAALVAWRIVTAWTSLVG